jgi:hypothetical protein
MILRTMAVLALGLAAGGAPAQEASKKALKVALTKASPKKGSLRPGFGLKAEGAEAAKNSVVHRGDVAGLKSAILSWYAQALHVTELVWPGLRKIGVASRSNVAMLYALDRQPGASEVYAHPPDGAVGIPVAFSNSREFPNPVPGTDGGKGCGYPVVVRLELLHSDLQSAELTDAAGRPVAGTFASPAKPVPGMSENSDVAFFVPSKPLAPGMTYKATFKIAGMERPLVWSFTTAR